MFRHGQINRPDAPPAVIDLNRGTARAGQSADLAVFAGAVRVQIVAKPAVWVMPPAGADTAVLIANCDAIEVRRRLGPDIGGMWEERGGPEHVVRACSGTLGVQPGRHLGEHCRFGMRAAEYAVMDGVALFPAVRAVVIYDVPIQSCAMSGVYAAAYSRSESPSLLGIEAAAA